MPTKLPKKVKIFIKPVDTTHEGALAVFWRTYRIAVKLYFKDELGEATLLKLENEILYEVLNIPHKNHLIIRGKRPKKSEPTLDQLCKALKKSLQNNTKSKNNNKPAHSAAPKSKTPKKPIVLIRRAPRPESGC
jgi:hypothetical protein